MVEFVAFVQEPYRQTKEWKNVEKIAAQLLSDLKSDVVQARLALANRPKASSLLVQEAFADRAQALGFESERKGLFLHSIQGLRPDYYLRMGDTGILLEVERGRIIANNMDMIDFWKCHICTEAHYLFLVVPKGLKHNDSESPSNKFATVQRRLKQFFEPDNYTNVRGLCLFGY